MMSGSPAKMVKRTMAPVPARTITFHPAAVATTETIANGSAKIVITERTRSFISITVILVEILKDQ
jgi:hypothetical protein